MANINPILRNSKVGISIDGEEVISTYDEITAVAKSVLTTISTYTVPVGKSFFLESVDFGGTNIAEYTLLIDNVLEAKKRTWWTGDLKDSFDFRCGINKGLGVDAGKEIKIKVIHERDSLGSFESRILGVLKS